jgi:2-amino-4-hydroxy-6-hydroxymethyldihydropteridine diphosphokinase
MYIYAYVYLRLRLRLHLPTSVRPEVTRVYIGLGSNLGDREEAIAGALERLADDPALDVVAVSTLRETDPVGPVLEQPKFLNGVAAIETTLSPRRLLDLLLSVEHEHGRTRDGPAGGPRTLDLDLLLYGDLELDEPDLSIPHPRLHERRFVLEPLAELDPALVVPERGGVQGLLARLN